MHVIRLRGPWQYEPLARTLLLADGSTCAEPGDLPPPGEVKMPADWGDTLGGYFRGRVRYSRKFNRPTGIEQGDRLFLRIQQVDAFGSAALNEHPLGEIPSGGNPQRFEVTRLLQPFNQLVIEVELPRSTADSAPLPRPKRDDLPGGLVGEVRLEIENGEQQRQPRSTAQSGRNDA